MSVTATSTPRLRLTDEELVLLGAEHPAVELPFLAGLKESERSVAIAVAYRSLISHDAVGDDGAIRVPGHLLDLVQARQDAETVFALTGTDLRRECWTGRYLIGIDDLLLVEDVGSDGLHTFQFVEPHTLPGLVHDWVAPLEPIAAQGDPIPVSRLGEPWGELRFRLDATVHRRARPRGRLIGALGGSAGTWLTDVEPGTPGEIELEPTDLDGLVRRLLSLAPSAVLAGCSADAGRGAAQ